MARFDEDRTLDRLAQRGELDEKLLTKLAVMVAAIVLDGEPVAFDALEFDPIIASGDLLYDLAFLL